MIKDQNTKKLIALYLMVRVGKISLDIVESKGLLTEKSEQYGGYAFALMSLTMSVFFSSLFIFDFRVLKSWEALNWLYSVQNQPNDKILRDLMRKRL